MLYPIFYSGRFIRGSSAVTVRLSKPDDQGNMSLVLGELWWEESSPVPPLQAPWRLVWVRTGLPW